MSNLRWSIHINTGINTGTNCIPRSYCNSPSFCLSASLLALEKSRSCIHSSKTDAWNSMYKIGYHTTYTLVFIWMCVPPSCTFQQNAIQSRCPGNRSLAPEFIDCFTLSRWVQVARRGYWVRARGFAFEKLFLPVVRLIPNHSAYAVLNSYACPVQSGISPR